MRFPCATLAIAFFVFLMTFLVVLPLTCNDIKTSMYYNKTFTLDPQAIQRKLTLENDERKLQARRYLSALSAESARDAVGRAKGDENNQTRPRIELMIVTQSRNRLGTKLQKYEPFYLTQVVAEWLKLIQKARASDFRYNLRLSICNVDEDPATYYEARNLSRHVPVLYRFTKKAHFKLSSAGSRARKHKEKEDFVFCHKKLLARRPDYILVVEDDALPNTDFFTVLQHILDTHLQKRYVRGEESDLEEVAWIKLYHPDYFSAFIAYEIERVPEWLALSLVIGTLLFLSIEKAAPGIKQTHFIWLLCLSYALLLVLVIGRPTWTKLRHFLSPYLYSIYPAPGCCMPGMLYTSRGLEKVVDYMQKTMTLHRKWAKDQVLDLFMGKPNNNLTRYLVQPNLLTHIGMVSGVRVAVDQFRVDQ